MGFLGTIGNKVSNYFFKKKDLKISGLIILVIVSALSVSAQPLPLSKNKIVVIAHRGNHRSVPENTLAAYKKAIQAGADYVEMDLRTTKDSMLVLMHNETVDQTTDGRGKISNLTYKEVRGLKIKNLNTHSREVYRVPNFGQVLKLCKNKINIYLDFKEADVGHTAQMIRKEGMEKQVIVYVNQEGQYRQWKEIAPHLPIITSIPQKLSQEQLDSFLVQKPVQVVDNAYHAETVQLLQKKGVTVWIDVEFPDEGPEIWENALQLGVNGIQTDHPQELIQYLKETGKR